MRALLQGLPAESQVVAIENPGAALYSLTNELLAALIEVVDGSALRTAAVTAGSAGAKWRPPKPITVPRPWAQAKRSADAPKVRRKATHQDIETVFRDRLRGGV